MSQVPMSKTQAQEVFCREFVYRRNLNYPGLTRTIVVVDGKVARPTKVYRSKTKAHGTDIYCLDQLSWSKAWVVELVQSNSGKRHVYFENVPDEDAQMIKTAWLEKGWPVDAMEALIELLNKLHNARQRLGV
jgi:hypothetical protein